MQIVNQKLEDILGSLRHLEVDWKDETANHVIDQLRGMPVKASYSVDDVEALLDANFDEGILICRLFMGLSKDQFTASLHAARGSAGIGVKAYRADSAGFLSDLVRIGLLDDMANEANRKAHWSDVLVERLRSGRGSAIAGQRRGKGVEDFAEEIIKTVFGDSYEARCTFRGTHDTTAKCDFAIPSKKRRADPGRIKRVRCHRFKDDGYSRGRTRYRFSKTRRHRVAVLYGRSDVERAPERPAKAGRATEQR